MPNNNPITAEEYAAVKMALARGATIISVAEIFGRHKNSVQRMNVSKDYWDYMRMNEDRAEKAKERTRKAEAAKLAKPAETAKPAEAAKPGATVQHVTDHPQNYAILPQKPTAEPGSEIALIKNIYRSIADMDIRLKDMESMQRNGINRLINAIDKMNERNQAIAEELVKIEETIRRAWN